MGASPSTHDYDIIIIGAGSGGLTAAGFAASLGARTCLVEKSKIGGDCTWTGCVPSKALLHVAKVAHHARTGGGNTGVTSTSVNVDMSHVHNYIHSRIDDIYQHETPSKIREKGVDVIVNTAASFLNPHTIKLTPSSSSSEEEKNNESNGRDSRTSITASYFIICTGAKPKSPRTVNIEIEPSVQYLTYENIFNLTQLPKHLCVVGGGPIGSEMSQAFQRLGSQVTIIGKILPREFLDSQTVVADVFEKEGIKHVDGRAIKIKIQQGNESQKEEKEDKNEDKNEDKRTSYAVTIRNKQGDETTLYCDQILLAIGRVPVVDNLGLSNINLATGKNGIVVNASLQTSHSHIYAAGDCCGSEQFTHYAGWQAFQAVRNALLPSTSNGHSSLIPRCTFTDPEIASVGLSLVEALQKYGSDKSRIKEIRRDAAKNDRAVCDSDAAGGFISLVVDVKTDLILGGRCVMSRAGETINEIAVAIKNKLTVAQLGGTIHTYPSYSFALQQLAAEYAMQTFLKSTAGNCAKNWSVCCGVFRLKK